MRLGVRGTNSKLLITPRALSRLRQSRKDLSHQILGIRGSFCLLGKRNKTWLEPFAGTSSGGEKGWLRGSSGKKQAQVSSDCSNAVILSMVQDPFESCHISRGKFCTKQQRNV